MAAHRKLVGTGLMFVLGTVIAFTVPARQALSQVSSPAADHFRIEGAIGEPSDWTVERLRRQFSPALHAVSYTVKGTQYRATCVPLMTLIQSAHPQFDSRVKNHVLSFAILVAGRDGYTACFSLSELSPDGGNHPVWIALDQNGGKLDSKAGPAELLVPDDRKPGRWVRGISRIEVVDMRQIVRR